MQIDIYNQAGEIVSKQELPKEIFEVEFKNELVHQALIRQLSNARSPIAHTLTKGEVRGGGRKPYRQKGTGRARQGSITNPHYIGGGVAHGPRSVRNFQKNMPKKQRRKALFMALSSKAKDAKIFGLEGYKDTDLKTKNLATLFKKLPIKRNVLFVLPGRDDNFKRVSRNLENIKSVTSGYLNIHDLLKFDSLCFIGDSIEKTKTIFST